MSPRAILFLGNFLFSISTAISIYILLPFLSSYMPEAYAGLVIAAGGFLALALFFLLPRLEARYGAQKLVLAFAGVEMLALLALAAAPGAAAGVLCIVLALALQPCISYGLDLLLEAAAEGTASMGRIRTIFLTAWNIGVLIAPLLLGALLLNSNAYSRVFILAAAMLAPFVVLFVLRDLPSTRTPQLSHLRDTLVCISRNRDLSAVTFAHFLLYLFYIWAPLYVPIYLHAELGIPWSSLGWIFSVMLIPYILLEYPAGWIADRYVGDKELLFVGFFLAGTALASLSFLSSNSSLVLILSILVVSRIGTALIESMTEGHFFRRVSADDINSMSFFRGVWPLAYTVGPLAASAILLVGNFHIFFLLAGTFIATAGLIATARIKDFR